jgi:hypothetical protein
METEFCVICLDDIKTYHVNVIQLPTARSTCTCIGYVHHACMNKWSKQKNNEKVCPICLSPFRRSKFRNMIDRCILISIRSLCIMMMLYMFVELIIEWRKYILYHHL